MSYTKNSKDKIELSFHKTLRKTKKIKRVYVIYYKMNV